MNGQTDGLFLGSTAGVRGGPGCVGGVFLQYCKENKLTPADAIPKVDVKLKLHRVSEFDQKRGTWACTFVLMLDWVDPSLSMAANPLKPNFEDHFWPKCEILDVANDSPDPPSPPAPKYKPELPPKQGTFGIHHATTTTKYTCVIYVSPNYSDFPFDVQILQISVKLLGIRIPGANGSVRPQASDPLRWRWKDGHEMTRDSDCLPEFSIVRLVGKSYSSKHGPFPADNLAGRDKESWEKDIKKYGSQWSPDNYIDQYSLQIIISRNSTSVLWNMCFSLFVIDCLVFSAHGIPIDALESRMGVNLSLLLTAMAFKWVLSDKLPDVVSFFNPNQVCFLGSSGSVILCRKIFTCFFFFFFFFFFIIAILDNNGKVCNHDVHDVVFARHDVLVFVIFK